MEIQEVKPHSVDNGFCRVYYKIGKQLYCFQAEDYEGKIIVFYVCTYPYGEPNYEIDWKATFPNTKFIPPQGFTETEKQVRAYLENHYGKTL